MLLAITSTKGRLALLRAKPTEERLAELVGVNPRTVQKIEAGKLNVLATTLERLKDALKCDWDELME